MSVGTEIKTRQAFQEYKEQNAKLLHDALIDPVETMFEPVPKLILPLINIVNEYSLSLPDYENQNELQKYYFSSWQEIIDNFPNFVQWAIEDGKGGISKLTDILRRIATIINVSKVGDDDDKSNNLVCELTVYGLLSEQQSHCDQRALCRQTFVPHLSLSVKHLCSGGFPYKKNFDTNHTFWENLVSILWVRPGDIFLGTREIENAELQVQKQSAISCIRNYHSFRSSTRTCADVEKSNAQLILLVDHLLN